MRSGGAERSGSERRSRWGAGGSCRRRRPHLLVGRLVSAERGRVGLLGEFGLPRERRGESAVKVLALAEGQRQVLRHTRRQVRRADEKGRGDPGARLPRPYRAGRRPCNVPRHTCGGQTCVAHHSSESYWQRREDKHLKCFFLVTSQSYGDRVASTASLGLFGGCGSALHVCPKNVKRAAVHERCAF